jgi:predicted RNA-binding Zn-ribbon protein involved in translation (DUF1610 family)
LVGYSLEELAASSTGRDILVSQSNLGVQAVTPRDFDDYDDDFDHRIDFADPGGRSALRAASKKNPRNLPCPNCGKKNRLTPADRRLGYQCDECADRAERGCD